MEPVIPIHQTKPSPVWYGTLADLLASLLAGLGTLTALGYSLYYFTRFLENDSHFWGIISAFLLCFGLGAFGYIPAAIVSRIAWNARKNGAQRKPLIWALILLIPWICLSFIFVFMSGLPLLYSLPILVIVLLLTLWGMISLSRLKQV